MPNYYSDHENAYEEGYSEGYDEGVTEGWDSGKSEGKVAWRNLYRFLVERGHIDDGEEITTFDMFERLYDYERELKERISFFEKKVLHRSLPEGETSFRIEDAGNKDNL